MAVSSLAPRGLDRLSDEELLEIYHLERDSLAREELVKRFLPFARKLALRYVHSREPLDDLVQVASVGLLNAIERFEPGRGKKFTSFAAPTIVGELKRHFRDKGWTVPSRGICRSGHSRSAATPSACPPCTVARRG